MLIFQGVKMDGWKMFFSFPKKVVSKFYVNFLGAVNGNAEDHPKKGTIQKEMNCLEQQTDKTYVEYSQCTYASCVLKSVH